MNNFKYVLAFTLGAAIGSVVTWKILKTKCEKQLQEELESIRVEFSKHAEPVAEQAAEPVVEEKKKISPKTYGQMTMNLGYTTPDVLDSENEISVITPDEFGQFSDYRTVNLTYYADNVLAYDDDDGRLDDIEHAVGSEFLDRFGEYEAGVVHVRNDKMMTDFEISLDTRTYADVVGDTRVPVINGHGSK